MIIKKTTFFIFLAFVSQILIAQNFIEKTKNIFTDKNKHFSGTITYEIISEKIDLNALKKISIPKQVQVSYLDFLSKFVYKTEQQELIVFDDGASQSSLLQVKIGAKTYAVVSKNEEINKSLMKFPILKITETTLEKEICGMKCKKIILKSDKLETEAFVTYDLNIPNPNWHSQNAEIKGVLLEYTIIKDNFKLRYIAINLKPQKFVIDDFKPSPDTEIITQVELNKILQKKY